MTEPPQGSVRAVYPLSDQRSLTIELTTVGPARQRDLELLAQLAGLIEANQRDDLLDKPGVK